MVVLKPHELDLILDNIAEHCRPFIVAMVGSGMRFGELVFVNVAGRPI